MPNVNVLNPIRIASSVPISAFIVGGISISSVDISTMPAIPWAGAPKVTVNAPVSAIITGGGITLPSSMTISGWSVANPIAVQLGGTSLVHVSNSPTIASITNPIAINSLPSITVGAVTNAISSYVMNPNAVTFTNTLSSLITNPSLTVNGTVSSFVVNPNSVSVTMSGSTLVYNASGSPLYTNFTNTSISSHIVGTPNVNIASMGGNALTTALPVSLAAAISGAVSITSPVSSYLLNASTSSIVSNIVSVKQSGNWAVTGFTQIIEGTRGAHIGSPLYTYDVNAPGATGPSSSYIMGIANVNDQSVRGWLKADKANPAEGAILAGNGRYSVDAFPNPYYINATTTGASASASLNIADASYQAYPKQLLLSIQASAATLNASGYIIISVLQGDGGNPEIWHGSRNLYTQAGMVDQSVQSLNATKLFTGGLTPGLNGLMSYQLPVNSNALLHYDPHGANLKLNLAWTSLSGTARIYARWILIY